MYLEQIRPMTDEEKAVLREILERGPVVTVSSTVKWFAVWGGGVLFFAAALAWAVANIETSNWFGLVFILVPIPGILCLYLAIVTITSHVHWSRLDRKFHKEIAASARRDLEDGRVLVKTVRSERVIEIDVDDEDDCSGYLFDVGNGKILILKGPDYLPKDDSTAWPNTDFEIVRTVEDRQLVGFHCRGDELPPVRVIPSTECKEGIVQWGADREDLLDADLEEYARSIIADA